MAAQILSTQMCDPANSSGRRLRTGYAAYLATQNTTVAASNVEKQGMGVPFRPDRPARILLEQAEELLRPKGLVRFTSGRDPGRYVVEADENGVATMRPAEPRRA